MRRLAGQNPNRKIDTSPVFALIMLLLAMISIQSGAALAKYIFPVIGAQVTSALRLALAAVLLCVFWRPWRTKLSAKAWTAIIAYGVVLGTMNLFFYMSIERIPLGIAVAIEFSGPLAVSLLASRSSLDFLWAFLAALGIYLILPVSELAQPLDPLGILFAFIAAAFWALYILAGQRAVSFVPGGIVTSLGMMIAAFVVFPIGTVGADLTRLTPTLFGFALGVAVFSSALPYSLEMIALKQISKKKFGILMSVEPAIAAVSGFLLLGERLTTLQWSAIACIIFASLGTATTSERSEQVG